jgi:isoleucyl-tRNA synthetase
MPGKRTDSVFVETWYQGLFDGGEGRLNAAAWAQVLAIKTAVSKQLERMRKEGTIGSSLDAEVTLYCDDATLAVLRELADELRFVLITSYAEAMPLADAPDGAQATELAGLRVVATASAYPKCPRCWHHRADVGANADHPELCGRCVQNIEGDGEVRRFA